MLKTAIGKKDGWKQERQIANRVKSMLKDGGTKRMQTDGGKMSRQDHVQVQDGGQQTIRHFWELEGPVGAIKVNSVEQKYIKYDRWGQ